MNRAAQVTMVALALSASGCARARSALPPDPSRVRDLGPPIEMTPVEPIRTSINAGKIPADLSTVRASYEVDASAAIAKATAPAPTATEDRSRPTEPPDRPELAAAPKGVEEAEPAKIADPVAAVSVLSARATAELPEPAPAPFAAEATTESLAATPSPAAEPSASALSPAPEAVAPDPDDPQAPAGAPKVADRPGTTEPAAEKKAGEPAMTIKADPDLAPGKAATKTVAVVGDTIITGRMLYTAMCQRMGMKPGEIAQIPPDQRGAAAKGTLDSLIEYTMILQEGRREAKKVQQWNAFTDFVDKDWKEKELPALLRKENAENEFVLKRKLEAQGENLDDMKDAWKLQHMSTQLLMMRVQPKVRKPTLPELQAYYIEHRNDTSFHREAKVHWREILVPVAEPKDLPAAREKAAALRARLAAGEDFARLAKTASGGVTAAKGGAWVTSQDGSAIPAINEALAKIAVGQISPPIESPNGIHLIRVEKRTTSGPAPFVDVQREIASTLFDARFHEQIEIYLKNLRKRTNVTSPMFDVGNGPPPVAQDPAKVDPQTRPASAAPAPGQR